MECGACEHYRRRHSGGLRPKHLCDKTNGKAEPHADDVDVEFLDESPSTALELEDSEQIVKQGRSQEDSRGLLEETNGLCLDDDILVPTNDLAESALPKDVVTDPTRDRNTTHDTERQAVYTRLELALPKSTYPDSMARTPHDVVADLISDPRRAKAYGQIYVHLCYKLGTNFAHWQKYMSQMILGKINFDEFRQYTGAYMDNDIMELQIELIKRAKKVVVKDNQAANQYEAME
jgi:hypothetical protein